ncbi:MAG: hypothetical protein ACI379_07960 [Nocardioides sp.]|uniref:hypothetical protein n=1 Tax=Nocardioides sp. TaxID=35761 RepID=UPI003F00A352
MTESTSVRTAETVALSVHGPAGVLDLVVPLAATSVDVAKAYASEAGLASMPLLQRPTGELVPAGRSLGELGIGAGSLLIASAGVHRPRQSSVMASLRNMPDTPALAGLVASLAVFAGLLASWYAARSGDDLGRTVVVGVLMLCALLAALPWGRHAVQRTAAAPAFAAAAAFAAVYAPGVHLLPTVIAVCALAAAVVAGVGRALSGTTDEAATVWIASSLVVAGACVLNPLLEWAPVVVWSILLVLSMLAARFVPSLAIDVPDEALLDLERLAVTAWSARDTRDGRGKRGRIVVAAAAMDRMVASASRTVAAASVAIAVVTLVAAPLLLTSSTLSPDVIGTRCLIFLVGASLLLAARSYRHWVPRLFLRVGGIGAWAVLAFHLLSTGSGWAVALTVALMLLGVVVVLAAVATGRGWRSVWWARRAEVGESLAGAFALAAAVVSSGLFRIVWEITS